METTEQYTQRHIAAWFDETYEQRGFKYLRPFEAYPIFLQLLGARENQTLLDVACGPGLLLKAACLRGLKSTGVDLSRTAVEVARNYAAGSEVVEGSAESLRFADGTFELVTCIGALERFLDREKALAEMRRVARDGARFCFMVRNSSTIGWTVWRRWLGRRNRRGHQDAKTLGEWRALFRANGFEIEALYIDQWFRQKLRWIWRGFRRHDFRKPEPVAKPILPLRYANQFVFILREKCESTRVNDG